jgi:hypothetical protein
MQDAGTESQVIAQVDTALKGLIGLSVLVAFSMSLFMTDIEVTFKVTVNLQLS